MSLFDLAALGALAANLRALASLVAAAAKLVRAFRSKR
jgi:hypothetical protein